MIKLITSIKPSDNGNKFLCENCTHARTRTGRQTETLILCTAESGPDRPVPFRVTQCSDYQEQSVFEKETVRAMLKQYWPLEHFQGRLTFVPPGAKRDFFGNVLELSPTSAPASAEETPPLKPN